MLACCAKSCTAILTIEPKKPGAWAPSSAHIAAAGSCLMTKVVPNLTINVNKDTVQTNMLKMLQTLAAAAETHPTANQAPHCQCN